MKPGSSSPARPDHQTRQRPPDALGAPTYPAWHRTSIRVRPIGVGYQHLVTGGRRLGNERSPGPCEPRSVDGIGLGWIVLPVAEAALPAGRIQGPDRRSRLFLSHATAREPTSWQSRLRPTVKGPKITEPPQICTATPPTTTRRPPSAPTGGTAPAGPAGQGAQARPAHAAADAGRPT